VEVDQEKAPETDAVPPLSVEEASVCPYVIEVAVGQAVTDGVVLVAPPPPEFDPPPHPAAHKLARIPSQIAGCRPIIFISQPLPIYFLFPDRLPVRFSARSNLWPALRLPQPG
jgi:hypothetical protein